MNISQPRQKWTADKLPTGYPTQCTRAALKDAITDLAEQFVTKSLNDNKDFVNQGWGRRITSLVQLGHDELQERNNKIMLWAQGIGLLISLVAIAVALIN